MVPASVGAHLVEQITQKRPRYRRHRSLLNTPGIIDLRRRGPGIATIQLTDMTNIGQAGMQPAQVFM